MFFLLLINFIFTEAEPTFLTSAIKKSFFDSSINSSKKSHSKTASPQKEKKSKDKEEKKSKNKNEDKGKEEKKTEN